MVNRLRLVAAAAIVVMGTGPLFAQATATISGRVVDQAGAVLPGATVIITNT